MMNLERRKLSLKKNDQVQVMSGREKGKIGKLLKVDANKNQVLVEKLNLVKRHTRATQKATAGIIEKESPIHYSNVLLFCAKCDRGVRHGHKVLEVKETKKSKASKANVADAKKKVRVCKRCGEVLDQA